MKITDHEEAWDLAQTKLEDSNLARAYVQLREAAQEVVDFYGAIPHDLVRDLNGVECPHPMHRLRLLCETNQD